MKELRPQLSFESYIAIYEQAHAADGHAIVAIEKDNNILAVMGYRFLWDFVRGKHLYIDDLVSTESARSKGFGAELLKFAEKLAADSKCTGMRLCAGIENARGSHFYNCNGWTKRAFAYVKKLS